MKSNKFLSILLVLVLIMSISTTVFADDGEVGDGETSNGQTNDGNQEPVSEQNCCEVLPVEDDLPVDGTFTVDAAIPGSENAAMTGDLAVGGETFNDVPAVCGDGDDVIYIGTPTNFQVCAVNDTACINAIRSEYLVDPFTEEQADTYGRAFDTIFRGSVGSGDYDPTVSSFRWLTGYSGSDPNPFESVTPSSTISTWIGNPYGSGIQSIAWWLGEYCEYEVPPEDPSNPPAPKPVHVQPNLGGGMDLGFLVPILLGLGMLLKKDN